MSARRSGELGEIKIAKAVHIRKRLEGAFEQITFGLAGLGVAKSQKKRRFALVVKHQYIEFFLGNQVQRAAQAVEELQRLTVFAVILIANLVAREILVGVDPKERLGNPKKGV